MYREIKETDEIITNERRIEKPRIKPQKCLIPIGKPFPDSYNINGVTYLVASRFRHRLLVDDSPEKCFGKALLSEAASLTEVDDNGIIKAENMCLTAGEED